MVMSTLCIKEGHFVKFGKQADYEEASLDPKEQNCKGQRKIRANS